MVREWPRSANSTRSVTASECRYCLRVDFVIASGTVWSLPPMVSSSGPRSSFAVLTSAGECGEKAAVAASNSGLAGEGIVHPLMQRVGFLLRQRVAAAVAEFLGRQGDSSVAIGRIPEYRQCPAQRGQR